MKANYEEKVNKTGDTLTGFLDFNNKDEYHAFRKATTINGVDYNANFGIGANQSARIEFQDANENLLGKLEVRSDGVYNGITDRKLVERVRQTWGTSLSFTMEIGQHALVMISNNDCLMIWVAGSADSPSMSFIRLYGTSAQATLSGTTVTINYSDNRNFTANAIIS